MTALIALTASAAVLGLLAVGLYALARLAKGWRSPSIVDLNQGGDNIRPAINALPARGYLTDAEHQLAREHAADIATLDSIEHRTRMRLAMLVGRALRDFDHRDRAWAFVHTGEYALVGVA